MPTHKTKVKGTNQMVVRKRKTTTRRKSPNTATRKKATRKKKTPATPSISLPLKTMGQLNRLCTSVTRIRTRGDKWSGAPVQQYMVELSRAVKCLESASLILSERESEIETKTKRTIGVGSQVILRDKARYGIFDSDSRVLVVLKVIEYTNDKGKKCAEFKVQLADGSDETVLLEPKRTIRLAKAGEMVDVQTEEEDEDDFIAGEDDVIEPPINEDPVDEDDEDYEDDDAEDEDEDEDEDDEDEDFDFADDEEEDDAEEEDEEEEEEKPKGVRRLRVRGKRS